MAGQPGVLIVREDMIIKGEIRNARQIEVYGYVEGDVAGQSLLVPLMAGEPGRSGIVCVLPPYSPSVPRSNALDSAI